MKSRNSEVLSSFIKYCEKHPEERFWQALRNWSGNAFIWATRERVVNDTFNWTGRTK